MLERKTYPERCQLRSAAIKGELIAAVWAPEPAPFGAGTVIPHKVGDS